MASKILLVKNQKGQSTILRGLPFFCVVTPLQFSPASGHFWRNTTNENPYHTIIISLLIHPRHRFSRSRVSTKKVVEVQGSLQNFLCVELTSISFLHCKQFILKVGFRLFFFSKR
tara:strand:- start:1507 stop:1851 length:345 start_codon:yes stop_codon:yes gene_type:complete